MIMIEIRGTDLSEIINVGIGVVAIAAAAYLLIFNPHTLLPGLD
jgi:hypothetical protein